MKKKVITIILLITLIILNNTVIYGFSINDVQGNNLPADTQNKIDNFGQGIIGIISTVGSIISVIVLIVIGIKYIVGSVEERAEYKKTMMPYLIGALFVFGITNILGIVSNITNGLL